MHLIIIDYNFNKNKNHLIMYSGGVLSKTHMHQSKTQFYSGDGTGRDTYIQGNNGGFCPATLPTKIEE